MEEKIIKIILVDDHIMFLEGLKALFSSVSDIEVVEVYTDGNQVLAELESRTVDLIVTDIDMPGMNGVVLTQELKKVNKNIKALVLSTHSDPETIQKVINSNADGYLLKNAEKNELINAIKTIVSGEKYFSKEVQEKLTESLFSNKKTLEEGNKVVLSKREAEILKLIAEELTAHEIAIQLYISQHTVNSHRKNLLAKLGAKNTAGLVKYAVVHGLI